MEMTTGEAIQAAIDSQAKKYYEADIRVQQGEDRETVARDLGLDKIGSGAGVRIGGSLFIPIEALIKNRIESDGRTTLQHKMSESEQKQVLENTLSNLEKANEKKRVIAEKRRNLFIGIGFVIGLFFLLGGE